LEKVPDENYVADLNEFSTHLQINLANGCHLGKFCVSIYFNRHIFGSIFKRKP
jgi:hypothetical protein